MLINPRLIIEDAFKYNQIPEENIQPNGIDFDINEVYELRAPSTVPYSAINSKQFFDLVPVKPNADGFFILEHNKVYDCSSSFHVNIPINIGARLEVRSTLNRLGVRLSSGFYDSNFNGLIGYTLQSTAGTIKIEKGSRVGQIVFFSGEASHAYDGQYNSQSQEHWSKTHSSGDVK